LDPLLVRTHQVVLVEEPAEVEGYFIPHDLGLLLEHVDHVPESLFNIKHSHVQLEPPAVDRCEVHHALDLVVENHRAGLLALAAQPSLFVDL